MYDHKVEQIGDRQWPAPRTSLAEERRQGPLRRSSNITSSTRPSSSVPLELREDS